MQIADISGRFDQGVEGSGGGFSQVGFEFAKAIWIGFRSGEYWGRKSIHAPRARRGGFGSGAFMDREIVEDHDIAWEEGRSQPRLDVVVEGLPIHRPRDDPGGVEPVMAQPRDEGLGTSFAERRVPDEAAAPDLTARRCSWRRN